MFLPCVLPYQLVDISMLRKPNCSKTTDVVSIPFEDEICTLQFADGQMICANDKKIFRIDAN